MKAEFELTGPILLSLSHDSPDLIPVILLEFASVVDALQNGFIFNPGLYHLTLLTSLTSVNQFLTGKKPSAAE